MMPLSMRCDFFTIMFKHKFPAIMTFLVVVMLGGAYLMTATSKYESVAQMVVRFGDQSMLNLDTGGRVRQLTPADRREIVLSHAAILGSPDLAAATIEAFGLESVYPDIIEHPPARWTPMNEATRRFRESLGVGVGLQDNVITVAYMHTDPAIAQTVVQKLIDLYVSQQTVVYHNPHSSFLDKEVETASARLTRTQASLENFKGEMQISNYDKEIEELLKRRGDVDASLHEAQANLEQATQRRTDLERLMHDVPRTLPESAGGEKYRSLDEAETRLAQLRQQRNQMLATYTAKSPALASLNAAIATAESDVRDRQKTLEERSSSNMNTVYQTMQTDYLRAVAESESGAEPVKVLSEHMAAIDKRLADLRQARVAFNDLTRQQALAEDVYKSLSTQFEEAKVKDSLNQQRISSAAIISQPTLPYRPARPRKLITLAVCLFAGALLGIGVALILEAFDDRFTTAEQVAAILGLPVLASFNNRRPTRRSLLPAQGNAI